MNFLANAPSFLRDFFKALFELPFFGKLLAQFLGFDDEKDATAKLDEELRQRKSLGALREFGQVKNLEGQVRDGKNKGEIKMLEGKDLSGIDRKSLERFFQFTKEAKAKDATKEFWSEIFNDGKVTIKGAGAEGKDEIYELKEKITEKDLDDNYKSLYKKLNKLADIRADRERDEREQENKAPAAPAPAPQNTPAQ